MLIVALSGRMAGQCAAESRYRLGSLFQLILVAMTTASFPDNPLPEDIRAGREAADLTQTAAARLVYHSLRNWQQWEGGERKMDPALWELFRLKTDAGGGISGHTYFVDLIATIKVVALHEPTSEEAQALLAVSRATFMRHVRTAREVLKMNIEAVPQAQGAPRYHVADFGVLNGERLMKG